MENYINGEDTVDLMSNIPTKGGKIRYLYKHHIWRRNRTKKVPHENRPHSAVEKNMELNFSMLNTNIESCNNVKTAFRNNILQPIYEVLINAKYSTLFTRYWKDWFTICFANYHISLIKDVWLQKNFLGYIWSIS